jgi:hypothetical protein
VVSVLSQKEYSTIPVGKNDEPCVSFLLRTLSCGGLLLLLKIDCSYEVM